MRCPVCKAETGDGPQCRRCRADLGPLQALEAERARALAEARRRAAEGHGRELLAAAERADALRGNATSRRLVALGHLLRYDFARAWRAYLDARRADGP